MKVLHVLSDRNIGGAGVLLCNLLQSFDAERIQSTVLLPRDSLLKPRISELGIEVGELERDCDGFSMASVREIRRWIRQTGAELLHANAALSARIAARQQGIPVVHTRHCCYPPSGIWRFSTVRWMGGFFNRRLSDRVIATAQAAALDLGTMGIPSDKIRVIINGSLEARAVEAWELAAARVRFGIKPEDFVIGICARLEECKGHRTFFEAAKQVMERLPWVPFRFLVVGAGSQREKLEEYCQSLGIAPFVRFTGFVEDMAVIYRLLRINVNCSTGTETSCLALSEGMSAGVPMIASDYGGNTDMIGDGRAGFLFPAGDACGLANAIVRIAEDINLENAMRRGAKERFEAHYTAKEMSQQVTHLYEEVLSLKT